MTIKLTSSGHFKLVKVKANSGKVVQELEFNNLITNVGLLRMGDNWDYLEYCRVGSGSREPHVDDNSLQNQIAWSSLKTITQGVSGSEPFYAWNRRVFTFNEGAAAGNLAEIGVGWTSSGSTLFSRALIRDTEGNPTAITVLSDEILYVTYEHRYHMPSEDFHGSVTFTGNLGGTYNYVGRLSRPNSTSYASAYMAQTSQQGSSGLSQNHVYSGSANGILTNPSGSSATANRATPTLNGLTVTHGVIVPANIGNFPNGIKTVEKTMGNCIFKFEFDPPIPKTSDDLLELYFDLTWGRHAS